MIPYKDDLPTERFPMVTVAFIALNVAVYIWELGVGADLAVRAFGAVPAAMLGAEPGLQPIAPGASVLTSMFMHGGPLHLAGNMLYLWIFGNNVEDRLGRVQFVLFYIGAGFVAAYAHALSAPASLVPMVGASGAVAGVLGAYLLMFPSARVHTLVFLGVFVTVVRLPALIVIGIWAMIQVVSAMLSQPESGSGGVAWFAHIGGFAYGLAYIKLFRGGNRSRRR